MSEHVCNHEHKTNFYNKQTYCKIDEYKKMLQKI